jgi:NAD(P)-dependent dehydrogenase (short-subunit alcohol dehydrogenase family)
VAFVTGGGTGLGLQISRGLAQLGATVVIASRKAEHHTAFLDEARERGWRAEAVILDVREATGVRDAARAVRERHGRVDLLVNNAAGNFVCPTERLSTNAWRSVLGIVLDGTFFCSKEFGRGMLEDGGGVQLNVIATYAWTGMPGVAHSASAKAGVLALTRTLAMEWSARGIRVNAIAPGPFHSDGARGNLWPDAEEEARVRAAIPMGRLATAEETAAHSLWLLSPASAYVTGECFVVDGGLSLSSRHLWKSGERLHRSRRTEDSPS